jgi:hypothetical protein
MNAEDMVDGHYDEDLIEDPLMAIVDKDLDDEDESEEELLRGDLADSDMIDIVAEEDPLSPIDIVDQVDMID